MSETSDPPATPSPSLPAEKQCRYCGTGLAIGARLCPECDRWQIPAGWLVSQVSLGDVALYGSVVVVLWSTFNVVLFGREARFDTTYLSCSAYGAEVYVANTGTSQGILVSGTVQPMAGSEVGTAVEASIARLGVRGERPVLEADSGDIMWLEVPVAARGGFDSQAEVAASNCAVALTVTAIKSPDGTKTTIHMPGACSCSDFR